MSSFVFPYEPLGQWDWGYKDHLVEHISRSFLNQTLMMFDYKNLPDTIPQRILELYLQLNGYVALVGVDDVLYAMGGGLGGELDANYMPTILTVSNPFLKYSASLKIGKECVVFSSDKMYMGLKDKIRLTASRLAENILSMRVCDINSRITSIITSSDSTTRASAETFIKQISEGRLGVVSDNAFLESLKTAPYGGDSKNLIPLIEEHQYIKASFFNDIGLNANFNMKREALNSFETCLNKCILKPLIADMLECRKNGIDEVNKMYGTNIEVSLSDIWKQQGDENNEDTGHREFESVTIPDGDKEETPTVIS